MFAAIDIPSSPASMATIEQAYFCLLDNYGGGSTVDPDAMLQHAWSSALIASGQSGPPQPLILPADPTGALRTFRTSLAPVLASAPDITTGSHIAEAALTGMAASLADDHTGYLPPDLFAHEVSSLSGHSTTGLGLRFAADDGQEQVFVFSVLAGSPASSSLQPGDVVQRINGHPVSDLVSSAGASAGALADALNNLPWSAGRTLQMDVFRPRTSASFSISLNTRTADAPDVEGKILPGNTGYVRIWSFSVTSGAEAIDMLRGDLKQQVSRIILDLRGNPGGSIFSARQVASAFTHRGPLATFQHRSDQWPLDVDSSVSLVNLPVTVLIDGGSASASEIVASALQDAHAATIVGSTSAGDVGTAGLFQLSDGGGLEITVAQLLRANGASLDGTGVTPDVSAPLTAAALSSGHDTTLEQALSGQTGAPTAALPDTGQRWVETFVADAQLWSGSDAQAAPFGAQPQWAHFLVVAPQQSPRLFVFDPRTHNYAWIDAAAVGPSGPP